MKRNHSFSLRIVGARVAAVLVMGCLMTSSVALAKDKTGSPFVGLWQGVDRADGSELQMSIVRNDGEFEVLLRDSFFSLCLMEGFTSGRGMDVGVGTLLEPNRLEFEFTMSCFSDADPATPVPVNDTTVDLSLRSKGEILVIEFEPEIFLHRISN